MVHPFFRLVTFALPFIVSPLVHAEVLFEGYSKVMSGGAHVGYTVSRYEYDPKTKHFSGVYFLKTGAAGGDITESVKSESDQELNPISYEYTSLVGKQSKTIDAKFSKGVMTATVDGKKKITTLKKGTFLSNFLIYLILKSKNGLQPGIPPYSYTAIAEEDAEPAKGDALVEKEETYNGQHAYRILNRFKDVKFTSYVSDRGEILATTSPANGISTELMAKPADATGSFPVSATIMKNLFGGIPAGTANAIARAAKEDAPPAGAIPGKQQSVPPGKGIQVKAEPGKTSASEEPKGKAK